MGVPARVVMLGLVGDHRSMSSERGPGDSSSG